MPKPNNLSVLQPQWQTQGGGTAPAAPPTQAPSGWDQTGPGVGEQFFNSQQGKFAQPSQTSTMYSQAQPAFAAPGQGEQYWNQVQGKFNQPTAAEGAHAAFQKQPSGLDKYYDRAEAQTVGGISDALAARGMQGHTQGIDKIGSAIAGLRGEQANREGDFNLRQDQFGAQLAQMADQGRLQQLMQGGQMAAGAQGLTMGRAGQGINAAGSADQIELARLMAGMTSAGAAQGMRGDRIQDMFRNILGSSGMAMGAAGGAYDNMFGADQQAFDATLGASSAQAREKVNQDYKHKQDAWAAVNNVGNFAGNVGSAAVPFV